MSDLHSINEAINKKAGRKLIPSILVGLALLGIIFSTMAFVPILFALFVLIAVLLALHELSAAFNARELKVNFTQLSIATISVIASSWFAGLPGLAISIVASIIGLLLLQLLKGTSGFVKNATATTFALMYPGFISGFIFLLARSGDGFAYISLLVILVGLNDTFAYLTGVLIGKHPMAPKISPKKTWEGFIGGLVFAATGSAFAFNYFLEQELWIGALAGVVGALAATTGDLIESAIKRDLSLKDMGKLLPGHGGMLDRLDAALITAPVFWCIIELIKRFG
ncbi:MAG: phosphatidate cytidylyltransferase [Candidatus Nanopelagicaceae bacterium]|jgi:phosphatidate cytidylyltransferase|nr:phosphatidate cytidylyltransferase [Actinomycetota bacterium]NCV43522.1 phosphatidate cytidylyltransferase [Actinomycetota bacterium]NCV83367.1 phosphatidate cytidylyltransferase [Actinomycetota bacterium]NCV96010.1 phosphatidate cytidylyltransferase [Actinomycetota bacterium]NCW47048.1 phosphatidate cytidylyltransferase [Actinomycetota bacterium]